MEALERAQSPAGSASTATDEDEKRFTSSETVSGTSSEQEEGQIDEEDEEEDEAGTEQMDDTELEDVTPAEFRDLLKDPKALLHKASDVLRRKFGLLFYYNF